MITTYGIIIDSDSGKIKYVTGEDSVDAYNKVVQVAKDLNDTVFVFRPDDGYEAYVDEHGNRQVLFGGW